MPATAPSLRRNAPEGRDRSGLYTAGPRRSPRKKESQLELSSTGLNLEEETPLTDGAVPERDIPLGIGLPSAAYAHVTMTLSFGATSKITVDVDGVKKDVDVSAQLYKAAPTIVLGYDSSSSQPSTIYFDDVIVDVR